MTQVLTGDRRALRVLVVDDDRAGADTLGMVLRAWGYHCQVAYDGAEGLDVARAFRPDCLVMDIEMPHLNGYELARHVRREPGLERAKCVALSGLSDEEHLRQADEAGFDHVFVKPCTFDQLEGVLAMMDAVVRLASQTEQLARQNVELAGQTKELLQEVKHDIAEVKDEVRQLKEDVREVRGAIADNDSPPPGGNTATDDREG